MRIKKEYQSALPDGTVLNTQSDSQTNTYSCDYINDNLLNAKLDKSNVKSSSTSSPGVNDVYNCSFINEITSLLYAARITQVQSWMNATKANGDTLNLLVPIFNPYNRLPSINVTNVRLFTGTQWVNIDNVAIKSYSRTYVNLQLTNSLQLNVGSWLVDITATIDCT